ncbi:MULTISPECIES: hypothetical protein [Mycobacterium avium complex (MAC)]|uniref:Uncharacterized protein n=1 Tax=Mycobacterium bouchedurhonense TaxID=701041 RepID=A0AAW5RZE2_MYCBC|nr:MULTISPECIES: hypothetical protein [Mycobacterium avium complex (MAC)]MCV6987729.1 hypothetical protein [Mycobacterium bouchedurhonense]MCV6998100.1 hypothetical protein [Mycobacterium timonense]MDV3306928.1 hypothetical protein [Mycobacterium avium subsp. hominissuis]QWY65324.1 hypothetical protein BJP78_26995 [Mycobacterium avium subsp. hominissuis]
MRIDIGGEHHAVGFGVRVRELGIAPVSERLVRSWREVDAVSYDVMIRRPDTDEVVWEANMTSNLVPMWRRAGADLAEFAGRTTEDVLPNLDAAISAMRAEPDTYRILNPPNGWGDFESCLAFLEAIRDACKTFGGNVVEVCR